MGCSAGLQAPAGTFQASTGQDFQRGILTRAALVSRYGLYALDSELPYLRSLKRRLLDGLGRPASFRITVLKSSQPLAVSAGAGQILLSRGLILSMEREEQLAFVIAHEVGHQILAHIEQGRPVRVTDIQAQELAADKFAAQLMLIVGFSPWNALEALTNFYHLEVGLGTRFRTSFSAGDQYPDVAKRVSVLQSWLRAGGIMPKRGTVRREFMRFKSDLREGNVGALYG